MLHVTGAKVGVVLVAMLGMPHEGRADLRNDERAVLFAVQREAARDNLTQRQDVCVAFDTRLKLDEKAILLELNRLRVPVHSYSWCSRGPRGLTIFIGPIQEPRTSTYNIAVDLGDSRPIVEQGAHFATLVRRGTYTIKSAEHSEPELVSYSETCCSKEEAPPTK
jgi:hypothetical protein